MVTTGSEHTTHVLLSFIFTCAFAYICKNLALDWRRYQKTLKTRPPALICPWSLVLARLALLGPSLLLTITVGTLVETVSWARPSNGDIGGRTTRVEKVKETETKRQRQRDGDTERRGEGGGSSLFGPALVNLALISFPGALIFLFSGAPAAAGASVSKTCPSVFR